MHYVSMAIVNIEAYHRLTRAGEADVTRIAISNFIRRIPRGSSNSSASRVLGISSAIRNVQKNGPCTQPAFCDALTLGCNNILGLFSEAGIKSTSRHPDSRKFCLSSSPFFITIVGTDVFTFQMQYYGLGGLAQQNSRPVSIYHEMLQYNLKLKKGSAHRSCMRQHRGRHLVSVSRIWAIGRTGKGSHH